MDITNQSQITSYRKNIQKRLDKKTKSLQFLPKCFDEFQNIKTIIYKDQKLKTSYLIDIIHNLILKYYFKKDNKYTINATVLKERYGYLYNYYIKYLIEKKILYMVCNYKKGVTSRIYSLDISIFKQRIKRVHNEDKVLIKKYKKKVFNSIDFIDENVSLIKPDIREKLISDLFSIDVEYERSIFFLDCLKKEDVDIYNRNVYSVESINGKHIFYHFDNYGRLHTNFTILKSFIRKNCLLIDGEETCELDIKNSQPLFLCKLINDTQTVWVDKKEYEFFRDLTINGNFYQYLMQVTGQKDRKLVKEFTYKVLFGRNASNSKADKAFSNIFPTIHHFIKLYKREYGNYKVLAHDLQRAESNLVYNKIINKIMILHPEIKIVTVHDSIIFAKKYRDVVTAIFDYEISQEFSLK